MKTYKKPVVTVDAEYGTDGELMAARVWQWQTGQILMEQLL